MQGDAGAGLGEFQLSFFNYKNSSQLQACFVLKKEQIDTILLLLKQGKSQTVFPECSIHPWAQIIQGYTHYSG